MVVPTTLIALTIVHITSIFILPTSMSCKTEHTYSAAMYEYCRINLVMFYGSVTGGKSEPSVDNISKF